jgi:cytidyltransferase-like protein
MCCFLSLFQYNTHKHIYKDILWNILSYGKQYLDTVEHNQGEGRGVVMHKIGYYPGSFKPLHRGHYESILKAKELVDELIVIASAGDRARPGEFPLSGEASRVYMETYIEPALATHGISLEVVSGSPVRATYDAIKEISEPDITIYLFAGPEDLSRYNKASLIRNFPDLMTKRRIVVKPTSVITGENENVRISGTATRKALAAKDLETFRSMLPNIPSVQRNTKAIMKLFIDASKNVGTLKEDILYEYIRLITEELLTEAREKKRKKRENS